MDNQSTPLKRWIHAEWGNGVRLAKALGCSRQYVSILARPKTRIRPDVCIAIERVAGIPCEAIRPDLNWPVIKGYLQKDVPLTETPKSS